MRGYAAKGRASATNCGSSSPVKTVLSPEERVLATRFTATLLIEQELSTTARAQSNNGTLRFCILKSLPWTPGLLQAINFVDAFGVQGLG